MNPLRRTWDALQYVAPKSDAYNEIFNQTQFDAQYTVDFFGGYSWKLPKSFEVNKKATFLVFNVGVNNILNNKDQITGGYEQLRYDYVERNPDSFKPKYFYAFGTTYFVNLILRMN